MTVPPLIGENGVIQMEIKQTVSTVVDHTTIDANTQPIIGKREAESFVSANSGDTQCCKFSEVSRFRTRDSHAGEDKK